MSELERCLQTQTPKAMDFAGEMTHPPDCVPWALDMFAASVIEADMQYRQAGADPTNSELQYFDQKDPASFERFKDRIQNNQPVHGSLPLIDFCAGDGSIRDNADWAWQVYDQHFAKGLAKCHPMGSYLRSTLWMSCGDHLYEAHNDLFDGFLFHMSGKKRVRVWPVPIKYQRQVVFNHSDFKGRMATAPIDFELQPGQILFIPSGAMHEVIVHGDEPAVSVSFHMGSPFPMLTLCMQLNRMIRGGEVTVPPHMQKLDKFNMYFFEPSRFIDKSRKPTDGMPKDLQKALAKALQSQQVNKSTINTLLSNWWELAMTRTMYQGPFPERVAAVT